MRFVLIWAHIWGRGVLLGRVFAVLSIAGHSTEMEFAHPYQDYHHVSHSFDEYFEDFTMNFTMVNYSYLAAGIPKNAKLKTWKTIERNGFLYVWHHINDEEPDWEPPELEQLKGVQHMGEFRTIFNSHLVVTIEHLGRAIIQSLNNLFHSS